MTDRCPKCGEEVECLADRVKGTVVGKRADNMPIIDYIPVHIPGGMDCLRKQNAKLRDMVDKQSRLLRAGIHLVQSMPVPSGEWPPVAARWRREAEAAAREAGKEKNYD